MTDIQNPQLAGRVALVTGTAQGIGQAIAAALVEAGATVVGLDTRAQTDTDALLSGYADRWATHTVDITDEKSVRSVVRTIGDTYGRLDILVNNAGVDDAVGIDDLTPERWRRVLQVNLEAPFLLVLATLPLLRKGGYGRIVNISSGSVVNPMTGFVAYRASKMGLIGMTRALSTELGRDGITVNAVSPGVTATPMVADSLDDQFLKLTLAKQGVKRAGAPADIAAAVTFLAGPDAGFVTGQTLMVNGGAAFG
nr:SDR family oxidoreductase [Rhodococcus wratislaviensis]GLK33558.1 3-oxoacyl-ACP reductase [Rhodococcus wratislaviensis]